MRSASCALLSAAFFCSDFSAALARTAISSQPSCVGRAMPILKSQAKPHIKASVPERAKDGTLVFKDWLEFRPNLRPEEVLQLGSFGGGYFRKIKSGVTKQVHEGAWEEFPEAWFKGLNIATHVASDVYNPAVNQYGVRSGKTMGRKDPFGLEAWETSGWIVDQDPFGWFQWYCRFYMGRRSEDDARQIGRWEAICGEKGRWKRNLIAKCVREGKAFEDSSCAPVVRQTLQHWAYRLTRADYCKYAAEIAAGARTAFITASSMSLLDMEAAQRVSQQARASAAESASVRNSLSRGANSGSDGPHRACVKRSAAAARTRQPTKRAKGGDADGDADEDAAERTPRTRCRR